MRVVAFVLSFLFVISNPFPAVFAKRVPKELPVSVSIQSLVEDEAQYNGHRIVVSGRILSIFLQRGRLGSPYLEIHLTEDRPQNRLKGPTVEVISLGVQKIWPGDKVLVQGSYRISGKKAGLFFEHFIDAEIIVPDLS
ncbi:MAG: hypothetical protein ACE5F7_01555 [Nitrospiria bacterium]